MTTVNDLETNDLLIKASQYQQWVSSLIRNGDLRKAAEKASEFHEITRKLDWRIQKLLPKERP